MDIHKHTHIIVTCVKLPHTLKLGHDKLTICKLTITLHHSLFEAFRMSNRGIKANNETMTKVHWHIQASGFLC